MKILNFALVTLVLASGSAFADSIDSQLDQVNKFVEVGEPTYHGDHFLGCTATEDANGDCNVNVEARAAQVCKLLGYGKPTAYDANYNAKDAAEANGKSTAMWSLDKDGNLVNSGYANGQFNYMTLDGRSSYIFSLTCTKK